MNRWRRRSRLLRLFAGTLVVLVSNTGTSYAQSTSAPAVKAAFLYNFAKFAEWPADSLAPAQRLSLCVIGDNMVADALERTIDGRAVEGHELTVQVLKIDGPIRSCHLLYVSGLDAKRSAQLFETLKGAAVLTTSDSAAFATSGGIAQLILENDRMRFAINPAAAKRARLTLSSKLLSLAQIVKDEPDVSR